MGAQERNPRLDIQWPGLYTAHTSGKKSKHSRPASELQEVRNKKIKEKSWKTCEQNSAQIVRNPRGVRAVFTYSGCDEGHKSLVSHNTRPNTISPRLGGGYKTHGRHTTKVRHLVNNLPKYIGYSYSCRIGTGGSLDIWSKQDRAYYVAIIMAIDGK